MLFGYGSSRKPVQPVNPKPCWALELLERLRWPTGSCLAEWGPRSMEGSMLVTCPWPIAEATSLVSKHPCLLVRLGGLIYRATKCGHWVRSLLLSGICINLTLTLWDKLYHTILLIRKLRLWKVNQLAQGNREQKTEPEAETKGYSHWSPCFLASLKGVWNLIFETSILTVHSWR